MLTGVYNNIQDYITSPEAIIEREKTEEENANMVLREMNENQNEFSGMNIGGNGNPNSNGYAFDQHFPNNYSNVSYTGSKGHNNNNHRWNNNQPTNHHEFVHSNSNSPHQHKKKGNHLEHVASNQQCTVTKYGDSVALNHKERIVTDHSDAILCVFFVDGNHIATGSKDKTINIYSL